MASFICKMCGGNLEFIESESVCECDHCGRRQTVPKPDDDKKMALFERANQLRADCDFDKAAGIYEAIAAEFTEEAEAYWGLVLCKYGIEYVDDPLTRGKIPTCHRSSFNSVFDDADYKATLEHATVVQRDLYEAEAKQIESLRRAIIEVSEKEEPYDVFICFKEHDAKGDRTPDSVFAQEIYEALTEKGYRVFFSRITLENILGTEYEPYIFAALNSAKVMLAFGTSAEYYNSVWVKNEWSRFLQLIAAGEKKTLIPCYADMPIDEMPQGFSIRQAQNMAKLGWQQDLVHAVEKLVGKKNEKVSALSEREKELLIKIEKSNKRNKLYFKIALIFVAFIIFRFVLLSSFVEQQTFFDFRGIEVKLNSYIVKALLFGSLPVFIGFGLNFILGLKSKIANAIYFTAFSILSIVLIILNCCYIKGSLLINALYILLFCVFVVSFWLSYKNALKKGTVLGIVACALCIIQLLTLGIKPPVIKRNTAKDQIQITKETVGFYNEVNGSLLGKVHRDQIFNVLDTHYEAGMVWYKIKAYNQTGWVGFCFNDNPEAKEPIVFLPENGLTQSNESDSSVPQLQIVTSFINIRTSPNRKSEIVGIVRYGEVYTIIDTTGSTWYKIKTNWGVEGYIYAGNYDSYVRLDQ